jgi:hypothetical protein
MREFELVMWSCFSKADRIQEIVDENRDATPEVVSK